MFRYYVNYHAQFNGDHEVHKDGCPFMPTLKNRIDLGYQQNDYAAMVAARRIYVRADGCACCCPVIHTS